MKEREEIPLKPRRRGKSVSEKKPATKKRQTKQQKKKITPTGVLRVAVVVVACIALLWGIVSLAWHLIASYYAGLLTYQTATEEQNYATELLTGAYRPPTPANTETNEPFTGEDTHGLLNNKNLPSICDTKDVTNILLLATDSRGLDAGRTDTMILLSINEKTGKIVLCSFMRDILAAFPEFPQNVVYGNTGYDKLTHAHAYGGAELTMAVLKETFNINVSYYAKVNFASFVDIIDAVGGIDMHLTVGEVEYINSMYKDPDIKEWIDNGGETKPLEKKEGVHHLNGAHALAHARNRDIGADYARTDRQRQIIDTLIKKAASLSLTELNSAVTTILPMVTTNMPKAMVTGLIKSAPTMLGYDVESLRLPQPGMYTEESYNFILDLPKNCAVLYEKIYGEPAPAQNS